MATKEPVETAWYDFIDANGGGIIHRGNKFLERISLKTEIDTVPTMTLTIPLEEMPSDMAKWNTMQIKVFLSQKYVFWGIIDSFEIDYAHYSVSLSLSHIVAEHRTQFMPVNLIVKNMPLKNLYNQMDFAMDGWVYEFSDKAAAARIEYTFSAENKLAAISECVEQTEDIHWRVRLTEEKVVQFGEFGEISPVVASEARSFPDECTDNQTSEYFPAMLTEPVLQMDFTDHVNRIVVLCGDIDKDVEHLTLRHVYEHPEWWANGFPIGMYEKNINQQDETKYDDSNTNYGSSDNASTGIVADSIHVRAQRSAY